MDAAMDALAVLNEGREKDARASVSALLLKAVASTLRRSRPSTRSGTVTPWSVSTR